MSSHALNEARSLTGAKSSEMEREYSLPSQNMVEEWSVYCIGAENAKLFLS